MFTDALNEKISEISEPTIVLDSKDAEFMNDVETLIELFELE
jgi:hypothetical protein